MYLPTPRRTVFGLLAASLVVGVSPTTAMAATGPSKAERAGCKGEYSKYAHYDYALKRGDKEYKSIGFIRLYARDSPTKSKGTLRVCVRTIHGYNTNNLKVKTSIKIGSYKRGGKTTWYYSSSGMFASSTQGVALTAGKGRSPIVSGSMVVAGKTYSLTYKPSGYSN